MTWTPAAIQSHYAGDQDHLQLLLSETRPALLTDKGYSGHLFGLTLPTSVQMLNNGRQAMLEGTHFQFLVRGNFIWFRHMV